MQTADDNSDIINFLDFLKENINKDEYKKYNEVSSGITNLFNIFDQDNRIYTVNYDNVSLIRYILLENNKVLKITVCKIIDVCSITYELFTNAHEFEIETIREADGRRRIQISNNEKSLCNDKEYLSIYNLKLLPSKVALKYVLEPISILELVERFNEIKGKKLVK